MAAVPALLRAGDAAASLLATVATTAAHFARLGGRRGGGGCWAMAMAMSYEDQQTMAESLNRRKSIFLSHTS
eukprot:COSAG01_NODE_10610_length_2122_cov_5.129511_3_plen_71_part_01